MRFNIQYKLTFLIVAIVAIILGGLYRYLNSQFENNAYERIHYHLAQDLSLTQRLVEKNYPSFPVIKEIDALTDEIAQDMDLRVTIMDLSGKVLGDSKLNIEAVQAVENHLYRPEIQQALKEGHGESRRFSTTTQTDFLYMAKPFTSKQSRGILRLAIPLAEINLLSQKLIQSLLAAFAGAFVMSIIIGYFAAQLIAKPMEDIATVAKQIAGGDFNAKTRIQKNDEIGDLATAINFMSKQIRERINEVESSKSKLEAVFLSMFGGVIVTDDQGQIILMNDDLKNVFSVKKDPLGFKPIEVIRNIEIQDLTDTILQTKVGVQSKEIKLLLPEEKIMQVHATPVIREGEVDGAVLIFHDITELRKLESIRQDFVANVSHELRTPVSTIKGYAETLLEGALDDKQNAIDFLKIIYTDSDRLAKLINDLLDLARIESGKMNLVFQSAQLADVFDRALLVLQRQIDEKKIHISSESLKNSPAVNIDETSIAQVFLNLIENAIKYNKDNGSIDISARVMGSFVEVTIADTGIGIPGEDLPRLFERFYRVDKARSRELGGTGLGLSIVKHIIQSHGGEVTVSSEPNIGSTFRFTLPIA